MVLSSDIIFHSYRHYLITWSSRDCHTHFHSFLAFTFSVGLQVFIDDFIDVLGKVIVLDSC